MAESKIGFNGYNKVFDYEATTTSGTTYSATAECYVPPNCYYRVFALAFWSSGKPTGLKISIDDTDVVEDTNYDDGMSVSYENFTRGYGATVKVLSKIANVNGSRNVWTYIEWFPFV